MALGSIPVWNTLSHSSDARMVDQLSSSCDMGLYEMTPSLTTAAEQPPQMAIPPAQNLRKRQSVFRKRRVLLFTAPLAVSF